MITIDSQDSSHQYDDSGRAITDWDPKRGNWIVKKEYEHEKIDWWGKDNDFPGGYIKSDYDREFPKVEQGVDIRIKELEQKKEKIEEEISRIKNHMNLYEVDRFLSGLRN